MYKQKFNSEVILKTLKDLNAVHSDPYTSIIQDYKKICKELIKKNYDMNSTTRNTISYNPSSRSMDPNEGAMENNNASQTLLNTIMDQRDKIKSQEKERDKYIEDISQLRTKTLSLEDTVKSLERLTDELTQKFHAVNELKEKKATEALQLTLDNENLIIRFTTEKQKMAEEWNKLLTEQENWAKKEKEFHEKEQKLNESFAQLKRDNAKNNLQGVRSDPTMEGFTMYEENTNYARKNTGTKKDDFEVIETKYDYKYNSKLHNKAIISMVQDVKGEVVSTCSDDGFIKIFNVATMKEISSIYSGNNLPICMDFSSSSPDFFATGHNSNMVQIWSLRTERSKMSFTNHSEAVNTVKFYDNYKCWSGSSDRTLKLMDLKKGSVINTYMCISGCFSSATDGCYAIYTGHNDGKIKVWTENKKSAVIEDKVHDGRITDLQFSQDGNTLITFCKNESVCFWDIRMNKTRSSLNISNQGLPGGHCSISCDRDLRRQFVGGLEGVASIYDISSNNLKPLAKLNTGKYNVNHTIYSDVSDSLYFGNSNGEIIVFGASRE